MARKKDVLPDFSKRLATLLYGEKIPYWKLSNEIGIDRKCFTYWTYGYSLPDAWTVRWLSVRFSVSADWLLGLTSERKKIDFENSVLEHYKGGDYSRDEKKNDLSVFRERLKRALTDRGISKSILADRLERDRKTIFSWFNGSAIPNAFMLRELASFFHVSANWLLGLSDRVDGEL